MLNNCYLCRDKFSIKSKYLKSYFYIHQTKMFYFYTESPIGIIEISGSEEAVFEVSFVETLRFEPTETAILLQCATELAAYFAGERKHFGVKIMVNLN